MAHPTNHDLLTHVLHAIHQLDALVTQVDRRLIRFENQTEYRLGVIRRKQDQIMISLEDLQAAFDTQGATFTDFASDVTVTLQAQHDTLAAMQVTLDAATGNDAAQNAMIADLQAQLATAQSGNGTILARITSLTDAIKAADVAVDQTPPAP